MEIDYRHDLPDADVKARLEALGDYLHNRHGIQVVWSGDTGSFRGKYLVVSIEGELVLGEGVVHVTGKDPGMLWRRRAVEYLKRKLSTYLDPGCPLQDLPTGR